MMADMLAELKTDDKDEAEDSGKDIPLQKDSNKTKPAKKKTNSKKKLDDKETNSLRKTLEKMMGKK